MKLKTLIHTLQSPATPAKARTTRFFSSPSILFVFRIHSHYIAGGGWHSGFLQTRLQYYKKSHNCKQYRSPSGSSSSTAERESQSQSRVIISTPNQQPTKDKTATAAFRIAEQQPASQQSSLGGLAALHRVTMVYKHT